MKNSFNELGYSKHLQVLDQKIITSAHKSALEIMQKAQQRMASNPTAFNKSQLVRAINPHTMSLPILNLLKSSSVGEIAAKLTNSKRIQVWGSQLYIKPPYSANSGVGFHTDFQYIECFEKDVLTAWIPLNDIPVDSGSLIYVSKSHEISDSIVHLIGAEQSNLKAQREHILNNTSANFRWHETVSDASVGDIFFHSYKTIHGSEENKTPNARLAIAVGLLSDFSQVILEKDTYGYARNLDNPNICPTIYAKQ
ncbi:phytanoyl-CoA dioxygenase family protein [Pseudoalteromonas byunsanensis]|nr:phytanoyl-CoA dioxygenase family protein [Pseudoalteromonas byunsanensis]